MSKTKHSPKDQTILWIALPHGVAGGGVRLSVFVSPRLYFKGVSKAHLSPDFPDFVDWPRMVSSVRFWVEYGHDPGHGVEAQPAPLDPDAGDYWKAFFKQDTLVRPYRYKDYLNPYMDFHSYPVRDVLRYLRQLYQDAVQDSPVALPALQSPPLVALADNLGGLEAAMKDLPNPTPAQRGFYDAFKFYDRDQPKHLSPQIPEFDFHEVLSTLGDHPTLLRKLGLVLDLTIPAPQRSPSTLRLRLEWGNPPQGFNRDLTPWTWYTYMGDQFLALPRPHSEIRDGFLNLEDVDTSLSYRNPLYDLVQVDVDGAALKVLNAADTIEYLQQTDHLPLDMPQDAGLPSLRSAGIALTRAGRQVQLRDRLQASQGFDDLVESGSDEKLEFCADDLLRGYRVDVLRLSAQGDTLDYWRSLCRRSGTYHIPGTSLELPLSEDEEGYVKTASTTSNEGYKEGPDSDPLDNDKSRLYLHETVFCWDGWSLAAQRPGLASRSGTEMKDKPVSSTPPGKAFPLEPELSAEPDSLPRLRFGNEYHLRARVVDVAGNSLPLLEENKDIIHASRAVSYLRYEPVIPPVLVRRAALTEGESLERMVIRSNYDKTAEEYVQQQYVQGKHYDAVNERHVAPPKASQLMAETHGAFDQWLDKPDEQAWEEAYEVALQEQGALQECHGEQQLVLPYLPDPAARGAALWPVPGKNYDRPPDAPVEVTMPREDLFVLKVPFYRLDEPWPKAVLPFRIQIQEPPTPDPDMDGLFNWDDDNSLLIFYLAKAQVRKLRYSSFLDETYQQHMGMLQWLQDLSDYEQFSKYVLDGLLWPVVPYRELTLVHAVQQPLLEPRLEDVYQPEALSVSKQVAGQTFAHIKAGIHLDNASTGKVELLAEWVEPVDDPAADTPKEIAGKQQVLELNVQQSYTYYFAIGGYTLGYQVPQAQVVRHEFGDTKHRWVKYHLRGTTRFREYFPPDSEAQGWDFTRSGPPVPGQESIPQYPGVMPAGRSKVWGVNIPSSARPAAPKVQYVVPNFGWKHVGLPDGGVARTRLGGGLRVYMERPWYSSGDNELLGVVLWPSSDPGSIPDKAKPLVTQFGLDPIWDSNVVSPTLAPGDFAAPRPDGFTDPVYGTASLEEIQDAGVNVVGFVPEWNAERKLWYCDIQIKPPKLAAYCPFIRLALARYQPYSLDDKLKLSRVVLADFAQLMPDRKLTVTQHGLTTLHVSLLGYSMTGEGYDDGYVSYTSRVEATLEGRSDDAVDEPVGWVPIRSQPLQTTSAGSEEVGEILPGGSTDYFCKWEGDLTLAPTGTKHVRLVVKEYEAFGGDFVIVREAITGDQRYVKPERIVYADTVVIM